jgi:hypothetical protein
MVSTQHSVTRMGLRLPAGGAAHQEGSHASIVPGVHIRPRVHHLASQPAHRAAVSVLRVAQEVERGAALVVGAVHVGAAIYEQASDLLAVLSDCLMKGRVTVPVDCKLIHTLRQAKQAPPH